MQIKDILKKGVEILKENNIEQNNLKAKMLLSSILNKSKEYLIIYSDEEISKELEKDFFDKFFHNLQYRKLYKMHHLRILD